MIAEGTGRQARSRRNHRQKPETRRILFDQSNAHCRRCGVPIAYDTFHIAHLRAAVNGGPAILENLAAWCAPCNIAFGAHDVCDTRVPPRPWQAEALPLIVEKLTQARVATLMAAPGAGKTLFSATVFSLGQDAGLWDRLVVLVPRLPLVKQWKKAVHTQYHIDLDIKDDSIRYGLEREGVDGLCLTYQALQDPDVRERHHDHIRRVRTLVVLDEVHHLGQSVRGGDDGLAWARYVKAVVGDLQSGLDAYVLNLSGTLFRTAPTERISTVQYVSVTGDRGEARIQAVADYKIHPEQLVREHLLRAPDLYRVGATIELVKLRTAEVVEGAIVDLDRDSARIALSQANRIPEWRTTLVAATLQHLEMRFRDTKGRVPVKALVVTHRQEQAYAFKEEFDRQMTARGLKAFADVIVSDQGPDAYGRLEAFRTMKRVGVLCTVGMVGEGYDCDSICVLTYATNIMTAQYIRQVVARAQRVTPLERELLGHPMTAAIIVPDLPELVAFFTALLAPMVHDLEIPSEPEAGPSPAPVGGPGLPGLRQPSGQVMGLRDVEVDVITSIGLDGHADIDPALVDVLSPAVIKWGMPEHLTPRIGLIIQDYQDARPFDPPIVGERPPVSSRPMTSSELQDAIRARIVKAGNWWAQRVEKEQKGPPVSHFWTTCRAVAGLTTRQAYHRATLAQLQSVEAEARRLIERWCADHDLPLPSWWAEGV